MKLSEYIKIAKVGDIVKFNINGWFNKEREITDIEGTILRGRTISTKEFDENNKHYGTAWGFSINDYPDGDIEIINNNKNMNLKEKFMLAFTKEPQKSFRKAGITDGDDLLTTEGTQVFLSWLLHNKFSDEFKKGIVDDILKDADKEE